MLKNNMLIKRARLFAKMVSCKAFNRRDPVVAYLLITDRCNLRCRYCFVDVEQKRDELSTDEWIKIINETVRRGTKMICLMGGEPLLHPDIDQIIDHIHSKGIICDMTTNGWLLPNKIELIKKLDSIMISIDGDAEATDINRGEGAFAKALRAIEIARQNNIVVRLNAVMTQQSINSIEFLLDLAEKHDLYVTFSITAEFPEKYENLANQIMLNEQQIRDLYKKLKILRAEGKRILFSDLCLDYVINYPTAYNEIIFKGSPHAQYYTKGCLFGRTMYYIDANGDFYPCAALWNHEAFTPKNIRKDGFENAWNNMSGLKCISCFCPGVPEWNDIMSFSGLLRGLKISLLQSKSRGRK